MELKSLQQTVTRRVTEVSPELISLSQYLHTNPEIPFEEVKACAALVMLIFGLLLWRLMVVSTHAPDLLGAMIAVGILGHMAIQVILNIAVVTNTIPNTGITLPFISYGGTSVLFLLSEMGLALNVSRHKK